MDVKFLSLTSSLGMQLSSPLKAGISTSSQHIILFCSVENWPKAFLLDSTHLVKQSQSQKKILFVFP